MTNIKGAIEKSWNRDTCYPPLRDNYENSHPCTGQCAITALLIQDILGGSIVKCTEFHHYYNRLLDGTDVDITKEQFSDYELLIWDEIADREELLLNNDTRGRYELLKSRFIKNIQT